MYKIEVTCDARVVRHETAASLVDAVAIVSHYLVRGTPQERHATQAYLRRQLPQTIAADGAARFDVGAIVVEVARAH